MSGSGLPPHGETYLEKFPFWFSQLPNHTAFHRACGLLEAGINSFQAAEKLEESLQDIRQTFKGLLGPYHYKMLYDFLVATKFLPPRWVYTYPVCAGGGTAQGLRKMFEVSDKQTGPKPTQPCCKNSCTPSNKSPKRGGPRTT